MRKTNRFATIPVVLILALAMAAGACRKKEAAAPVMMEPTVAPIMVPTAVAVSVVSVDLGKSLGADKKVASATDTFAPGDTIFTVVSTDGSAASSTITVRWLYQDGQVVKEETRAISPTGPATTEFSIQKPGGWPKGDYKAEVSIDGGPVTSKNFKVQ